SCLPYLAAGALLAISRVAPRIIAASGIAAIVVLLLAALSGGEMRRIAIKGAAALISLWLVGRAWSGFGGLAGAILGSRPMVYIGRISYGLYLFHNFAAEALQHAVRFYGISVPPLAL